MLAGSLFYSSRFSIVSARGFIDVTSSDTCLNRLLSSENVRFFTPTPNCSGTFRNDRARRYYTSMPVAVEREMLSWLVRRFDVRLD